MNHHTFWAAVLTIVVLLLTVYATALFKMEDRSDRTQERLHKHELDPCAHGGCPW